MGNVLKEVRYSWYRILRSPLHNLLIVLSLALGVGVNTTVFSLANGVLLKPLPYPAPDRLVAVVESSPSGEMSPASPLEFVAFRTQARAFTSLAAWAEARSNLLT